MVHIRLKYKNKRIKNGAITMLQKSIFTWNLVFIEIKSLVKTKMEVKNINNYESNQLIISQKFYNKQSKLKDRLKINRYKEYSSIINSIIDILLDDVSVRNINDNGHYFLLNKKTRYEIKISYTTNNFGEQPRYEIKIQEVLHNNSYIAHVDYYSGEIFQFRTPYTPVNTEVLKGIESKNKISTLVENLIYLVRYDDRISDDAYIRIRKYINKLIKLI